MSAIGRYLLGALGLLAWAVIPSQAEDLERGKSGPAIFAADCSACHRSAQGLAYRMSPSELMDLLRQHYTTGPGPANQVANYLLSVVGNGRRPKDKPGTEPQSTAAGPAGEQGKRRPRGEEAATESGGPRPPGDIKNRETTAGEEGGAGTDRPGAGSKRRQQAAHPAEPTLPIRSKKLGQPAIPTRGPDPEAARPPEAISAQPSETVAARPAEPAPVRQPGSSEEAKPAETAPRPVGAKAETASETGQAPPPAAAEVPKPTPRRNPDDQPAFSAPSP